MNRASKAATIVLVLVNIAVFAWCIYLSGSAAFGSRLLYRLGATSNETLIRHDYWRLVAHAFLHVNIIHILSNMMCLVIWGAVVEQRVGWVQFLIIYFASAIGGGIVSVLGHEESFIGVGASGATSGLLGALLALTLLRRIGLSFEFFATNIGLNVLIAVGVPEIDWMAHAGGFATGFVVCILLDQVALFLRR